MTDYLYDKSGQVLLFQREASAAVNTYGKVYDPETSGLTAFTKIPANYAHWRKLDYITESFDPILPIIEKLKMFDIGDSKHASMIASGNIEPVDFSIPMNAQGLEFLLYAIGNPALSGHTGVVKMIQTITCPVIDSITDVSYFFVDVVVASGATETHLFWFDQAGGSSAPTSPTGIADANRHELAVDAAGDADAVAVIVAAAINGVTGLAGTSTGAIVTITADNAGAAMPAHQGDAGGDTGLIYAVTTWGSSTYTVTEELTTDLPSFTLHVEQKNTTEAEDIVWDLFGCVIESVEVSIGFDDKVITYSVGIKCPFAAEGDRATNPPPKKLIPTMPSLHSVKEATDAVLIQDGATATINSTGDRTPTNVEKITFTITNNIKFLTNIGYRYKTTPASAKREVTMNIVGQTWEKELFDFWQGAYKLSGTDWVPTDGIGKLNTTLKLERTATNDYISIHVYNWLLREHNFTFITVDDAVKAVDMTFEDGSADSDGIILDATTMASYIDQILIVGGTA